MKKLVFVFIFLFCNNALANQLITAINQNAYKRAQALLDAGINPDIAGKNDITPLMQASMLGDVKMAKLLLKHKADPNKKDIANTTALHIAIRQGNDEIVEMLLKAGADVNAQDFSGATPLIRAVSKDRYSQIAEILHYNPNLYTKNKLGENAFTLALDKKDPYYTNILIREVPYTKIPYLNDIRKKALSLNKQETAALITAYIEELKNNKAINEKRITFKRSFLSDYTIKDIPEYPCLNSDIEDAEISSSFCIKGRNKFLFLATPMQRQQTPLRIDGQLSYGEIRKGILTEQAGYREWQANDTNVEFLTNEYLEPEIYADPNAPIKIGAKAPAKEIKFDRTNSVAVKKFSQGEIMDQSLIDPRLQMAIFSVHSFPKSKPEARTPINISKNSISEHTATDLIRTNEWNINTKHVPLSTIDYENLGADMIFNRKFSYIDSPSNSGFSFLSRKYKPKKSSYSKAATATKVAKKTTQKINSNSGYFIQLGIFSNFNNAKNLSRRASTFGKTTLSPITMKGKKLTKVLVGPFKTKSQALRTQKDPNFIYLFGGETLIKYK